MRIKSVDIFRALTMFLMVFVNDLWTLSDVPEWLKHTKASEDGMGLADVVFPAFLFIVGLAIPYAIKARVSRNEPAIKILMHIAERTIALLVMGLFMVNMEFIDEGQMFLSKHIWQVMMVIAFFLVWKEYRGGIKGRIPAYIMRVTGLSILVFLAAIYHGYDEGRSQWMSIHWWGILGLIGWGYLVNALVYFLLHDRPGWIALVCLVFYLMNINESVFFIPVRLKLVVSASNYASVTGGLLVTTILLRLKEKDRMNILIPVLACLVALFFTFGFASRPLWGISKIRATPSWTAICTGINMLVFIFLYLLADKMSITRWANIISPAGRSALTCYLVPYLVYPLLAFSGFNLPEFFLTGIAGIFKSIVFSLLIIWITGLLVKLNVRLKL
jgi:heparan-alpha-glucosaminide N-acetyltransferase